MTTMTANGKKVTWTRSGGSGELGTPPIAAAVTNAIFAATGKRFRTLPINTTLLKKA